MYNNLRYVFVAVVYRMARKSRQNTPRNMYKGTAEILYLILTLGTVDIFARRKHVHNGGPQGSVLCPEWTVYVQRTVPRQMLNLSQ